MVEVLCILENMLWALWIATSILLALLVTARWTIPHLTVLEVIAAATPVGLAASAWLCLVVSALLSSLR